MTKTDWSNLKWVDAKVQYRDEYTTYSGFLNEEDVKEYGRYLSENLFVYFPSITRCWEENGTWYAVVKMARSC